MSCLEHSDARANRVHSCHKKKENPQIDYIPIGQLQPHQSVYDGEMKAVSDISTKTARNTRA